MFTQHHDVRTCALLSQLRSKYEGNTFGRVCWCNVKYRLWYLFFYKVNVSVYCNLNTYKIIGQFCSNYLSKLFPQFENIISIARYKLRNIIWEEDVGGRSKSYQSCVCSKHVLSEHRQVIIHISRDLWFLATVFCECRTRRHKMLIFSKLLSKRDFLTHPL